jgi:hypothetical protein
LPRLALPRGGGPLLLALRRTVSTEPLPGVLP